MTVAFHEKWRLVCFRVLVQPHAEQNQITGPWNGALKIRIAAPAQDRRANRELLDFLADALGLCL